VKSLYFLKLGGSLITIKDQAHTPRPQAISSLAAEVRAALQQDPEKLVLLGHGSGSFGHVPAKEFATREGVQTQAQWHGFAEVWRQARELNTLVMQALSEAGLAVLAFPPSAVISAEDGQVISWDLSPIEAALNAGLVPVIYGDVVRPPARRHHPLNRRIVRLSGDSSRTLQDTAGRNGARRG
jgi:isopentenyl phosphate kinase